jgi:alpha-glucosidase
VTGGKEIWVDTKWWNPRFCKAVCYPEIPSSTICGELEFDELTLDLYYKEGKEISGLWRCKDGYDYKRQVQFLDFSINRKETGA